MTIRKLMLQAVLAGFVSLSTAASAIAAPIFNVDLHHHETNFAPGSDLGLEITTLTQGSAPATDEVQKLTVNAAGGVFTLTFNGATTAPQIKSIATADELEASLNSLSTIGGAGGSVNVSGGPGNISGSAPYLIAFGGALGATDLPELVATDAGIGGIGGLPEYWLDLSNVGDTTTAGPITVKVSLPPGITRGDAPREYKGNLDWSCPGSLGDSLIVCTTSDPLRRHTSDRGLMLPVNVQPAIASGTIRFATANVSGGGAVGVTNTVEPTRIDLNPAGFGVVAPSFLPDFFAIDGLTEERQAGAHPELLIVPFDFNSVSDPVFGNPDPAVNEDQYLKGAHAVRNLIVDLPAGFLGDPTAVGECSAAQFTIARCPASSQVGRIDVDLDPLTPNLSGGADHITTGVFNLTHPRGAITDLGFVFSGNPVHIKASLDPANRYAVITTVNDINETLPPFQQRLTVWGVPADPSHDSERCPQFSFGVGGDTSEECSTDLEPKPFLTLPSQCTDDNTFRLHTYDSWDNPGDFGPDITYTMPGLMQDCDRPRFDPEVEIVPTGAEANTPTGLDVSIRVPQNDNPNALATPPVKSTVVTFPQGMTVNPAFADGLDGCTLAQIGLGTNDPVQCPDNSRIGEVFLTTPLLPEPLEGSMYLAKQTDNAFGSTFAMYMAIHDTEERGVLVKIPGRIDLDPNTGQITTTFDELPQFPFDDFTLSFRSGQRAPLVNPPSCGTQRIEVRVASYAQPDRVLDASSTYQVSEGPNGTACPASSASRPFDPKMNAGTLNPTAGSFSPFVFRLTREDTEQDISKITTVLPPGLIGKLAGVATCPDSAIRSISTAEGTGRAESANPSCPANSLVGVLNAGVGAGTGPNYFQGKVYLAGPYRGAPLSLVTVTPAIAGPYDFGNVVVQVAADLDPRTAQVKAISDPFPPIVHGVLLHVRDVRLILNRDQFTLNPTSCSPMAIDAQILSDLGALASPSSRFQVGECASLDFKPRLSLRLKGGTKRGAHPALTATLTPRAGDANIASISVAFPKSEFLKNAHIRTVCTRADFAASNCPAGAIYGRATAFTPILDYPLQANVYLRSSSNLLPDVVPDFRGPEFQPIKFESAGRVDSINGGIRNTFDFIPDAPITRVLFALQGGKKGLLVNSRDICANTYRATVRFIAHNGARHTARPKMVANCGKASKAKKRRGHRRAR